MEKEAAELLKDREFQIKLKNIVDKNIDGINKITLTLLTNLAQFGETKYEKAVIVETVTDAFAALFLANMAETYRKQHGNRKKFGVHMKEIFTFTKRFCIDNLKVDW